MKKDRYSFIFTYSLTPSNTSLNALHTAVLLIAFNRPETTRLVFEAIRRVKPLRFYIALDGPRPGVATDIINCSKVQSILSDIDWECSVHTLFRKENLGCGKGPSTAITWFFDHEQEGIILEDDCLPSVTFFPFCEELLTKYREDMRVMHIGGNNFESIDERDRESSYRFSNLTYVWGWATWRRAWRLFDFTMSKHVEIDKKGYLSDTYQTIYERDFFDYVFKKMYKGDAVTSSKTIWDYQWQFACKINSGLVIVPNCNLVINLGFGKHSTNTTNSNALGHDLKMEEMRFPLYHPKVVMVDQEKETRIFRLANTSLRSRVKSHIKNVFPIEIFTRLVKPLATIFS